VADSNQAVFLSYAREDAAAAGRIADALRSHGVEVWFDQSELRGGDAWDAKIRKQINECMLFLPVISRTTQDRGKGYFRLEWKLAVEQTHLMAEGMAFLAPLVIDDTAESSAIVPPEFLRVQWTRLPGALPTPAFVEQVKRLLARNSAGTVSAVPAAAARPAQPAGSSTASPPKSSTTRWTIGAVTAIVVGVVTALMVSRKAEAPPSVPVPAAVKPAAAPVVNDKSIAVLPFTNMSEDKDSGYFADGIHEDILTNLAHIASLRVVSRTSVMEYRGTTENIRQIAQKLGVTYVLEGSVRRAGNKVRVTGQLIHAATDEHLWAQSYDRDLTDIFAIQAELAQEIAKALSAALSPEEKARLEHPMVTNPAAYDLLLRARQIDRDGNDTRQELETEEALLQSAVTLDPNYASAWGYLADVHAQIRFNAIDTSEARLAKARAAIDAARRLDPESRDVIASTGAYYYYALRNYAQALEYFGQLARQLPNDYSWPFMTGLIQRRQGKWLESLVNLRRAAELDPGSAEIARNLMLSLGAMRRYPEAIVEQQRRVHLLPESLRESFEVARLKFFQNGSTREGDELLAGPIAARADPAVADGYRKLWAAMKGDLATVARLDRERPDAWAPNIGSGGGSLAEYAWNNAIVMAARGDLTGARARVEKYPAELRARLVNEPRNGQVLAQLGQIEALLGHREAALAAAQQARDILPESLDALSSRGPHLAYAFVLAWTGDKAEACAELRQLLATSGQQSVHWFKNGPWFTPLKGDPAFEALLNDPKNQAPLY
jgi:TolB-like protein/Tfp pilus assembly protein PilF